MLNWDICRDLAQEIITISNDNPEYTTRFMFSNRESLDILRSFINRVDIIRFHYLTNYDDNNIPQYSSNIITLEWDEGAKIDVDLTNPNMGLAIRWALSATKEVEINVKDVLPPDLIKLLLKNQNLTKLELIQCDFPTIKLLVESRRFNYIKIEPDISENLNNIHIDTEELELCDVSLENILKTESIKTNSLITGYRSRSVSDDLFKINISPNFQSLERFKLIISNMYLTSNVEDIVQFLKFLNTKLPNLKLLVLEFVERRPEIFYVGYRQDFNIPPTAFKDLVNYENKLAVYDGKIKVKLNHTVTSELFPSPTEKMEKYCEQIKNELRDFNYSRVQDDRIIYSYKKSKNIKENFEVNILIQLTYYGTF